MVGAEGFEPPMFTQRGRVYSPPQHHRRCRTPIWFPELGSNKHFRIQSPVSCQLDDQGINEQDKRPWSSREDSNFRTRGNSFTDCLLWPLAYCWARASLFNSTPLGIPDSNRYDENQNLAGYQLPQSPSGCYLISLYSVVKVLRASDEHMKRPPSLLLSKVDGGLVHHVVVFQLR